jgi:ferredoxin-NADP reductase
MTTLPHPLHDTTVTLVGHEFEADLVVDRRTMATDDVVALQLRATGPEALPEWSPGAHIDLVGPTGITRQYSLCGDTSDRHTWRIAVLREEAGRGGSAAIHETLREGDPVRVRGPRNHFHLAASPRYLFIAGGVGITPLLPMIAQAEASGADWRLVYGGRTRTSMAFRDELAAYGDRVLLQPQDEVGLLHLDGFLTTPQPETLVYSCGPEALLTAVEQRCSGWPSGALRLERFAPEVIERSGEERAFEVVLERHGVTVTVPPDRSILEAVVEAGVNVLSSCQEGTCGTCETAVLEGTPEHRDSVLTPEEQAANEFMMICVSRCRGERLVLDL